MSYGVVLSTARLTGDAGETSGNVPRSQSDFGNDHAHNGLQRSHFATKLSETPVHSATSDSKQVLMLDAHVRRLSSPIGNDDSHKGLQATASDTETDHSDSSTSNTSSSSIGDNGTSTSTGETGDEAIPCPGGAGSAAARNRSHIPKADCRHSKAANPDPADNASARSIELHFGPTMTGSRQEKPDFLSFLVSQPVIVDPSLSGKTVVYTIGSEHSAVLNSNRDGHSVRHSGCGKASKNHTSGRSLEYGFNSKSNGTCQQAIVTSSPSALPDHMHLPQVGRSPSPSNSIPVFPRQISPSIYRHLPRKDAETSLKKTGRTANELAKMDSSAGLATGEASEFERFAIRKRERRQRRRLAKQRRRRGIAEPVPYKAAVNSVSNHATNATDPSTAAFNAPSPVVTTVPPATVVASSTTVAVATAATAEAEANRE
ncbi:unnamed protein product [Protopolystoma xenopodis]|uniref:Uncharacterized protein n=1 Tax=Protopolystoma xenopodis TaxID=117903 RepID=A0A448WAI6_9PLAT|nr:unnamed protein product [Protopolystoma xenopodis]